MFTSEKNHFPNFILIGMAGAGKSTIGALLSQRLHCSFIDTDDLIARSGNGELQQLLDTLGSERFRILEEKVLLSVTLRNHVIATGGSAIYSQRGMAHLRQNGLIIWLDATLEELESRVTNLDSRGLVNPENIGFAELYHQRVDLYRTYAALRIDCSSRLPLEIVEDIVCRVQSADFQG